NNSSFKPRDLDITTSELRPSSRREVPNQFVVVPPEAALYISPSLQLRGRQPYSIVRKIPYLIAPPKSRPPMSHRKTDLGIPGPRKICQSSASNERTATRPKYGVSGIAYNCALPMLWRT